VTVELRAYRPKKARPRVDQEIVLVRNEHFTKSLTCRWQLAAACPCDIEIDADGMISKPGRRREDCIGCHGTGIIYHSEQEIPVVVLSGALDPKRWQLYGESAAAMVKLTFLPEHIPSFYDRIEAVNAWMLYRESVVRRAGAITPLRQPVAHYPTTIGQKGDPTEPEELELGVIYCRRADSNGVLQPGELVEGTDFEVTEAGAIDWTLGDGLGTAPAIGAKFGVHYFTHPRYVVVSHPYFYRQTYILKKSKTAQLRSILVHADASLEFYGNRAEKGDGD
jgi:hypothetical protein